MNLRFELQQPLLTTFSIRSLRVPVLCSASLVRQSVQDPVGFDSAVLQPTEVCSSSLLESPLFCFGSFNFLDIDIGVVFLKASSPPRELLPDLDDLEDMGRALVLYYTIN